VLALHYDADLRALGPYTAAFRPLAPDEATQRWLAQTGARPHGRLQTWLVGRLASFVSVYDAHGLTGSYPMHLLSTEQWRSLVGEGHARLLDVGAGAGYVTAEAAPLFREVVCTETSKRLSRRLRARGFHVHEQDLTSSPLSDSGSYDVISCLNVLDRTRRPRTLLGRLRELLTTTARLLVAMPVPVRAHVHVAGGTVSADEPLPCAEQSFEAAVVELSRDLFEPAGFTVERIARAPYLSRGDTHAPIYMLDDALWVLRKATPEETT
jgi:SAM-dependent methyltransferase